MRKVKEDAVLDPTESLAETVGFHIGIDKFETFDGLHPHRKEEAGRRLQTLLDTVADGSLTPLMFFTLKGELIKKLVELRGLLPSILSEKCGLDSDSEFPLLSEGEKEDAGRRLGSLLRQVARGALVPLLDSVLSAEEVKKLCNLKGIVKEEPDDDLNTCEKDKFAAADADIPNWIQTLEEDPIQEKPSSPQQQQEQHSPSPSPLHEPPSSPIISETDAPSPPESGDELEIPSPEELPSSKRMDVAPSSPFSSLPDRDPHRNDLVEITNDLMVHRNFSLGRSFRIP